MADTPRMNDSERLGYDAVNLPTHYAIFKIEPVRFCVENNLNFLQASVLKYVVRYPHKNGVEDLKKARRMIDMLIAFEEGREDWWTQASSDPTLRSVPTTNQELEDLVHG